MTSSAGETHLAVSRDRSTEVGEQRSHDPRLPGSDPRSRIGARGVGRLRPSAISLSAIAAASRHAHVDRRASAPCRRAPPSPASTRFAAGRRQRRRPLDAWSRWVSGISAARRRAERRRDTPGTTSTGTPAATARVDLLAATSEDERVAALQADDDGAAGYAPRRTSNALIASCGSVWRVAALARRRSAARIRRRSRGRSRRSSPSWTTTVGRRERA